jgi:hypothetical protein
MIGYGPGDEDRVAGVVPDLRRKSVTGRAPVWGAAMEVLLPTGVELSADPSRGMRTANAPFRCMTT